MTVLYVADVAEKYGISKSGARAWLVRLEKEHGTKVVGRRGNKLYTTEAGLALTEPPLKGANLVDLIRDLTARLERLEKKRARVRSAVPALAKRLERLEKAANIG